MLPIPQPFNSFQWLQEFLSAIARGIVQPAVARAVYSIRVGTAVQEELHHGDTVGTDGITQGGDALVWGGFSKVLCADWRCFCDEVIGVAFI